MTCTPQSSRSSRSRPTTKAASISPTSRCATSSARPTGSTSATSSAPAHRLERNAIGRDAARRDRARGHHGDPRQGDPRRRRLGEHPDRRAREPPIFKITCSQSCSTCACSRRRSRSTRIRASSTTTRPDLREYCLGSNETPGTDAETRAKLKTANTRRRRDRHRGRHPRFLAQPAIGSQRSSRSCSRKAACSSRSAPTPDRRQGRDQAARSARLHREARPPITSCAPPRQRCAPGVRPACERARGLLCIAHMRLRFDRGTHLF